MIDWEISETRDSKNNCFTERFWRPHFRNPLYFFIFLQDSAGKTECYAKEWYGETCRWSLQQSFRWWVEVGQQLSQHKVFVLCGIATGWRWSIYDLIAPQFHSDPFFQKYRIWGPLTCNYDTENWCYRVGFDSQGMMTWTEYCYTRESRFPQPSFFFCSIDIIATRIPVILPLNIIRFLFLYIIIIYNPIIPVILPFNIIKAPFFICFSMIWGDDDWWCPVLCDEATAKTCGTGDFAECVALTEARLPRGLIGVDWVTMGWTDFVAWDDGIEPGEFQKFQKSESAKLRTNAQRFAPPNSRLAGFPTTTPKAPEKRKIPTALEISIGWSWLRI